MRTSKIKKVLIATDYAETAQTVAEKGYSLAKALGAETILLHVVYEQPVYYTGYAYMRELEVDITHDLHKSTGEFLDKLKKHLGDPAITTIVKDGVDIASTIVQTAEKEEADLIVLGSHSRSWLENVIMGSQTQEVLRKTDVPLYIVPTKKR